MVQELNGLLNNITLLPSALNKPGVFIFFKNRFYHKKRGIKIFLEKKGEKEYNTMEILYYYISDKICDKFIEIKIEEVLKCSQKGLYHVWM